ncbi:MAG: efflux RND transporter permease subunit [Candidatus Competibacteraceae bacterium]|nr:efflux RND transporter permease subunit [Candidatus Competibacteraceae bacterium]MCP5124469.1 efflux RND transporter permease subunit [Gammaproteobacteria bacterium]HRX72112.1 hypothetical protein [Candidatus Competibacteraceae bacterium]
MKGPNLSAWVIGYPALIRYLVGLLLLSGAYAYFALGQMEDPEFTLRGMVITVYWPGATAREGATGHRQAGGKIATSPLAGLHPQLL